MLDYRDLETWTGFILHYDMATVECGGLNDNGPCRLMNMGT